MPFLISSCEAEKPKERTIEDILETVDEGDFRGNKLGDDIQKVMAREQDNIVYSMPDELTCRIPMDIRDSTFYEISYNFNDMGLYVIELDVFPKSLEVAQQLFGRFKTYYDNKYGKSTVDDGYTSWFISSTRGTDVEISMIDESAEKGMPYLTIMFYEEDGIAK
jgi:hypothetical protein